MSSFYVQTTMKCWMVHRPRNIKMSAVQHGRTSKNNTSSMPSKNSFHWNAPIKERAMLDTYILQ